MTTKDYILIASTIKNRFDKYAVLYRGSELLLKSSKNIKKGVIYEFTNSLKYHLGFNSDSFIKACYDNKKEIK